MKIFIVIFFVLSLFSINYIWGSQQIETVVFPSEDEIAEAFALGDINFEQFILLTELITNQVDATSFLLNEIPHSLFRIDTINVNQSEYFLDTPPKKVTGITIKNKYASYLEKEPSTRQQTSIAYRNESIRCNLILKKEFSGRERFTRRYISYANPDKNYSIILGNYIKRFGLGTVLGYRGKLLSFDDEITNESFLFPDYGGSNGLYAESQSEHYKIQSATSFNRDNLSSVLSHAVMIEPNRKSFPVFIFGINSLKNRKTKNDFYDFKTALYNKFSYNSGHFSAEITADFNKQNNSTAFVVEGYHKVKKNKILYSFWNYGTAYLNISGGSKTSLISEYMNLEVFEDSIISKRSNQTGGMIKSQFHLSERWQFDFAMINAYKNKDTTELQLYSEFSRQFNNKSTLSIDILHRQKERNKDITDVPENKSKFRCMYVLNTKNYYIRNYISTNVRTDENSYLGLFSEIKLHTQQYGLLHLWFNFNRINHHTNQLDYFYGFIKNEFSINSSILLSFKISHRYYRTATTKNLNQISIDASWQI